MERNKIVYIHRKASDGSIFYVGMGNVERAYSRNRSAFWKRVVKRHGYTVEIVADRLTKEEAWDLEMALIKQYGRMDIKTGCLVNHTSGGPISNDLCEKSVRNKIKKLKKVKRTKEWNEKISKSMTGKVLSEETKQKLRISNKNSAKKTFKAVACYDCDTGEHLFDEVCVSDAARRLGCLTCCIFNNLSGKFRCVIKNNLNRKLKFKYIETNRKVHRGKNSRRRG